MIDIRPQLGRLPAEPGRPRLSLAPLAGLPTPPAEVHNLELIPDADMLGNDVWGDCVFASIENDRRCSRAALGLPLNKVGAAQVVASYKAFTGISTPPGPGAVVQRALEWVRHNGWPGSTDRLLAFGDPRVGILPIDQMVAEFHSGIFGVEIDAAQEYPAKVWDAVPSPFMGGHAIAAGTYTPSYTMAKTWGYIASMTPAYVAGKMGEVWATIWDFEWNSLSFERQTQVIADLAALTGDAWNGPAPVQPYTPRIAMNFVSMKAVRVADSRAGYQPHVPMLAPGDNVLDISAAVPAGTVHILGKLEIIAPGAKGFVNVGPDAAVPETSVNSWDARDGKTHPMAFSSPVDNGRLHVWNGTAVALQYDLDLTGAFTS
jgi:hypothetical protein